MEFLIGRMVTLFLDSGSVVENCNVIKLNDLYLVCIQNDVLRLFNHDHIIEMMVTDGLEIGVFEGTKEEEVMENEEYDLDDNGFIVQASENSAHVPEQISKNHEEVAENLQGYVDFAMGGN